MLNRMQERRDLKTNKHVQLSANRAKIAAKCVMYVTRWFYVISGNELKLEHSRKILDYGGLERFTVGRLKYKCSRKEQLSKQHKLASGKIHDY